MFEQRQEQQTCIYPESMAAYPIQTACQGCGCHPSTEAAMAAAKQGACAVIPNPGLEPTFIAPHLPNNVSVLSKIWLSKQTWFYPQHSTQVHSSVLTVPGHTVFQYITVSCTTTYLYSTCYSKNHSHWDISFSVLRMILISVQSMIFKDLELIQSKIIYRGTLQSTPQLERFPHQISALTIPATELI